MFTKNKKQNEAEWGAFHVVPQGRAEALSRRSKSFVTEDSIGAVTQVTEKRREVNKPAGL